eukprot:702347-Lingulodinium_polyedra.AAC.1
MIVQRISSFPICFLKIDAGGRCCPCAKHRIEEFDKAVAHVKKGTRDRHTWKTVPEMATIFGLPQLLGQLAPQTDHDFVIRKLNNLRGILDSTSTTKQYLLLNAAKTSVSNALFFICMTTMYLNEGPYILSF